MGRQEEQVAFHRTADAKRYRNRLANPWINKKETLLAKRLAALCPHGGRVLEVGCGEGNNLLYLRRGLPNSTFTGVDFSSAKTDFAKQEQPDVEFVCADALRLPFPDSCYDFVFCRDLLHHVDFDRHGVLSEMARVAKPGARLAVLESRGWTPLNLLFQLFYPVERGLLHSSPASLKQLSEDVKRIASAEIQFIEPTFFTRAFGFILGWPRPGALRAGAGVFYFFADLWESLLGTLLPKRFWAYMMMTCTTHDGE